MLVLGLWMLESVMYIFAVMKSFKMPKENIVRNKFTTENILSLGDDCSRPMLLHFLPTVYFTF